MFNKKTRLIQNFSEYLNEIIACIDIYSVNKI